MPSAGLVEAAYRSPYLGPARLIKPWRGRGERFGIPHTLDQNVAAVKHARALDASRDRTGNGRTGVTEVGEHPEFMHGPAACFPHPYITIPYEAGGQPTPPEMAQDPLAFVAGTECGPPAPPQRPACIPGVPVFRFEPLRFRRYAASARMKP